jgi:glycosyltransferase involved in cell wall biosynthesis
MNILIVMPLGEFGGGAEQMLATYLNGQHDREVVTLHLVFLSDGGLASVARRLGYPVEVVEAGRLREVNKWLRTQYRIGKIMDEWRIDRALAWMPKAGAYLAWPARRRGTVMMMWRHDIPRQLDRLDRWVLRYGKIHSVACSSMVAQSAFHDCAPEVPSCVIHPAASRLSHDVNSAERIRQSLLHGKRGPIIGTIARLQPWKRIDLFLQATALLKTAFPDIMVVIVGGESHGLSAGTGEELRQLGIALLGDSVLFAGEQRQVGNWLDAMDVFVLPSAGEPFGIVLVEALAAGKPVLACAGGGPEEIITSEVVGQILPATPTPQQMSQAIESLLHTRVRNQAQTTNVQAADRFSPASMIRQIDAWLAAST